MINYSTFQFNNPRLISFSLLVDPNGNSLINKHEVKFKVNKSKKNNSAIVVLYYNFGNCKKDKSKLNISAEIASIFVWNSVTDEKIIHNFLNINAPSLLLSYLRPIITNNAVASGFPMFMIPFMDFSKGLKKVNKKA